MTIAKQIPISDIATQWKATTETVLDFLNAKGIEPVSAFPFGKGTIRIYEVADIQAVGPVFQQWRSERRRNALAKSSSARERQERETKRDADIAALISKVDALHSMIVDVRRSLLPQPITANRPTQISLS